MVSVMVGCWVIGPVYNIPTVIETSLASPDNNSKKESKIIL